MFHDLINFLENPMKLLLKSDEFSITHKFYLLTVLKILNFFNELFSNVSSFSEEIVRSVNILSSKVIE